MTIGIIGAGISGLTLAHALQQNGQAYHLWEASDTPGGYIASRREALPNGQSCLIELGPNSLLGDQALLDWLGTLGLTNQLVFSKPVSKARFVFRNGRYRQLPTGPPGLLFGNFFSWNTKRAILRERQITSTSPVGETLGQFFRRRFSNEVVDYALGPFVAGIYAGDPEQLLVSETFPQLLDYERNYGSVLRGLIKNQGKTTRRQSFSFQDGMQTLPNALANQLTNLYLNTPVLTIDRVATGWAISTATGTTVVEKLVLATGAEASARLLDAHRPDLATALRALHYPPMTVVHSVYDRAAVGHRLNGFGGLNPKREGRFSAGHIWSSSIFDGRCPADMVLLTTFVGGQQQPDHAQQVDEEVFAQVHRELANAFQVQADAPTYRHLYRWERAIPQYDAASLPVKMLVPTLQTDCLFVCANWYDGVSLSDCIRKAQALAKALRS